MRFGASFAGKKKLITSPILNLSPDLTLMAVLFVVNKSQRALLLTPRHTGTPFVALSQSSRLQTSFRGETVLMHSCNLIIRNITCCTGIYCLITTICSMPPQKPEHPNPHQWLITSVERNLPHLLSACEEVIQLKSHVAYIPFTKVGAGFSTRTSFTKLVKPGQDSELGLLPQCNDSNHVPMWSKSWELFPRHLWHM